MQQQHLPFDDFDARWRARRATIANAVTILGGDCHLFRLLDWILECEARGKPLVKSYQQMADEPGGLYCSKATARRTVARAVEWDLVVPIERGGSVQEANGYRINWTELQRALCPVAASPPPVQAGHIEHGYAHIEHTYAHPEHTYAHIEHTPPDRNGADAPYTPRAGACGLSYDHVMSVDDDDRQQRRTPVGIESGQRAAPNQEPPALGHQDAAAVVGDLASLPRAEVVATAREARLRALGTPGPGSPRLTPETRELLLAASMLAHGGLGEEWLLGAARVVGAKRGVENRGGYLRSVLANRLAEHLGLCEAAEARALLGRLLALARPLVAQYESRRKPRDKLAGVDS